MKSSRKSTPPNSPLLSNIHIGTAGWTLPKDHVPAFPPPGDAKLTHLQRYAHRLHCVEINSSFHRPHMRKTWERWAATTPPNFRFSVKIPRTITHEAKLANTGALLQTFLDQATGLGAKLGPLLIQLPPSLAFDEPLARDFLTTFRELHPASELTANQAALEPRHASWFTPAADRLLRSFAIARVAADPPKGSPRAATPGGAQHLHYYRLHGAPRTYYSPYTDSDLTHIAHTLRTTPPATSLWVIFDNTALGHATANALHLSRLLNISSSHQSLLVV
jgi:uncharacterized protein YecE (DUF72 family)